MANHSKPKVRNKLRGEIHLHGFSRIKDFAEATGTTANRISRCIRGWEYPSPELQKKMAQALKMKMEQFITLL